MLDDLNLISWETLRLEYGTAGEIPELLEQFQSSGKNGYQAFENLYELLLRPASLDPNTYACEAHAYVVPVLIELIGTIEPSRRYEVLMLLNALVTSVSSEESRRFWPGHDPGTNTPESNARMAEEQGWVRATRSAVIAGAPEYLKLLDARDAGTRDLAVSLLAHCREQRSWIAPALTARLARPTDPRHVLHLIIALGFLLQGSRDAETEANLEAVLRDAAARPAFKLAAALSLARMRRADRTPELLALIRDLWIDHPDLYALTYFSGHQPLSWVVEIFGEGSQIYLDLLIESSRSQNESVRRDAFYRLGELCRKRRDVANTLAPVLLTGLHDPDVGCGSTAARGLAEIAGVVPLPCEPLKKALKEHNRQLRIALVTALSRRHDLCVIPAILETLSDPASNHFGRRDAVEALKELEADAAPVVPALRQMLGGDPSGEQRKLAVEVLSVIGPAARPALPEVRIALQDWMTQRFAAQALASWGPDATEVIPDLTGLLQSNCYRSKRIAAQALGRFGTAAVDAVPIMESLLTDEDWCLPPYAAFSLWQITGRLEPSLRRLIELLSAEVDRSEFEKIHPCAEAAKCLAQMGPLAAPAVPALHALLTHPVRQVRFQSALALWRITREPSTALPLLIDELQCGRPKIAAVAALQEMGSAAAPALPALRHLAESEERVILIPEGDSAIEEDEAIRHAAAAAIWTISEGREKGKTF